MMVTIPVPGFVSVVGPAVLGLPGDGIQAAPGLPAGLIDLSFFLLGQFLIRDKFFHIVLLFINCT